MRYTQLRAFHHVALHGGFSRAAEALFLTQPAISDQVRKLEEEYDILLFDRRKKQVTLTEEGRRLLEITRRLFETEHQALELLSESRALRAGTLRIVADSAHHVTGLLTRFRTQHPGVKVSLRVGNATEVVERLHRYEADVGVLGEFPQVRTLDWVPLDSAPLVAFVSADHPLAVEKSIHMSALSGQALVLREPGSRTRRKLEEAASTLGLTLDPAVVAEGREAVREIVAAGLGVGVVSAAEFTPDARLYALEITGAEGLQMDEALVCLRERRGGKLVRALFGLAEAQVAEEARPAGS